MYPGCRFMDLHPRDRDHMSYAPHPGSGFGHVLPHTKMDTARSPVNYQSFPCYGNYGCPYPLPYHGCYHNQIPDYHGYGLHYPHYPPPPPVYCNGTPLPGSYPFQYLPSPHYSAVDPRYEYDKKGSVDHHCCGCLNHLCQQKDNKNVKIEEQTSDDEKHKVDSLVPFELKDQSYPVSWIPPGYKRSEEGEQTIKPESKKLSCFDKEAKGSLKPCAQEPKVWNGWLPVDLNRINSLVPFELKDQSYPVSWIPPGYKSEEGEQTIKPESKKVSCFDKEAKGSLKPCAQEPSVWNGWLPVDRNNLNSLVQGRDEKGTEHQQNGDSKSSLPAGCMPSYPEQKDKLEPKDGDRKSIWDPSQFRIFPLKFIENQDKKSMPEGDVKDTENSSSENGPKRGDKNVVKKIIPVKQLVQSEEEVHSEADQTEENREPIVGKTHSDMPLKRTDKKGGKEHLENNRNVQSSLSKASKLPPVCLRVDPLPSRRTKGGSSTSPSPPANKKSEILSHDKSSSSSITQGNNQQEMQGNNQQEMQGNNQYEMQSSADSDPRRLQSGKKVKDVEVVDSMFRDNEVEAQKETLRQSPVNASAGDLQERVSSGCQDEKGVKSDEESSIGDAVKNVDKSSGEITKDDKLTIDVQSGYGKCETGTNEGTVDTKKSEQASINEVPKQKFSEAEAAVIIQAAYRGFEVRRWEPLKKMKEIARIEGELNKARQEVQNLVSTGSGNIDKQKIVIGETIMNLLLQLDTMQGLLPSLRNIRKSVAKGLVSLQEELDCITPQNSEELNESDMSKHGGEISKRASEEERQQAGEDRHARDTTFPSHMKSGVTELCQNQPHTLMDVNTSSVDIEKSELLSGTDEMGRASEETEQDSSSYVDLNGWHLEPLEVKEPSEVHGVCEDHDSFLVESKDFPPLSIAEEKINPVVQLQTLSSQVDSNSSSKEDEVAKVNTEVPPHAPEQNSNAQVSGEGLQIDGGRCIVEPGERELVQESGLISLGNKAKDLKFSDLEDNVATAVHSESSSELKDDIRAGDLERDKELSGDAMLGTEYVEASDEKHADNIKGEANVCAVEGDNELIDHRRTAAVEVDTEERTCEAEGEGDDKLVDDMHTTDIVGVEMQETPDIKEAVNVYEVEGDDMSGDDMQIADDIGLEQKGTPGVNKLGKDAGPVKEIGSAETCGPELSKATSDLKVKQQKPSSVKDTLCGEEVHMEEIANCNSEQKMAVIEDQEMWEDKFDNKEIYEKHSNIIDLPRGEDLVEEELTTKKVNKQPNGEFSSGEGDLAGEELIVEERRKESDKELVEENEKLKETVEKLIAAGKEQLTAISSLSERVRDLEKKLSRKKKLKMRRHKTPSQYLVQV